MSSREVELRSTIAGFTAEGKLVSLAPDGSYDTVADLPSGDVYPTSDGGLFCAVSDGTVAVYCATGDPTEALSVSVDDDLVPGGTDAVELSVENAGERPVARFGRQPRTATPSRR